MAGTVCLDGKGHLLCQKRKKKHNFGLGIIINLLFFSRVISQQVQLLSEGMLTRDAVFLFVLAEGCLPSSTKVTTEGTGPLPASPHFALPARLDFFVTGCKGPTCKSTKNLGSLWGHTFWSR